MKIVIKSLITLMAMIVAATFQFWYGLFDIRFSVFTVFLIFILGIWGWQKRIPDLGFCLIAAVLSVCAEVWGLLHVPVIMLSVVTSAVLGMGLWNIESKSFRFDLWKNHKKTAYRILVIILLYPFVLKLLQSLRLQSHGDAFYYHLVGPLSFLELGQIQISSAFPQVMQSSTWESLYLVLMAWIRPFKAININLQNITPAFQLISQLLHLVLGGAGIWFLLEKKYNERRSLLFSVLFSLSLWGMHGLDWTVFLAKNDWGCALWLIAGYLALKKRNWGMSGFFLALGVWGKFVYGPIFLPLVLIQLFRLKPRFLEFLKMVAMSGVVFAPFVLRNYLNTGNPFYPWENTIFPSSMMGPTLFRELSSLKMPFQMGFSTYPIQQRLLELLVAVPLWFPAVLFHFYNKIRLKRPVFLGDDDYELLGFLLSFVIWVLMMPAPAEFRYFAPVAFLLLGWAINQTVNALDLVKNLTTRFGLLFIAIIGLFFWTKPPHHSFLQHFPPRWKGVEAARTQHTQGDAKNWIRSHIDKTERILLVADNEVYYLWGWNFEVSTLSVGVDSEIERLTTSKQLADWICNRGYQWLIWSDRIPDQRPIMQDLITSWKTQFPSAIQYPGVLKLNSICSSENQSLQTE